MIYAAGGGGGSLGTLLFLVAMIGIMYLLIIRPQQRRRKQMQAMQSQIAPGSEVITIGGLHGTVIDIDDEVALIEAAPGVQLKFARAAISRVLESADAETDDADDADEAEEADETDASKTADSVIERTDK